MDLTLFPTSTWLTMVTADGLCVIDVTLRPGVSNELANYSVLKNGAARLIRACVQQARSGGRAAGYGI